MSGDFPINYTDIDGQYITMKIDANTMLVFALLKIIGGGLTVLMGRSSNRVFKPILKEYKDAERGITNGISMTKRRSK
jgi:hypothetical protein